MARIIIASTSEQVRSQLRGLLVSSGFSVFRLCESGSSLRRTINECEDGIVIFSGPLPDCKPEELQWDYGDRIQILLVGKPPVLDACESPDIFRLVLPTTGQALIGAVNMLSQLHQMQLPEQHRCYFRNLKTLQLMEIFIVLQLRLPLHSSRTWDFPLKN